MGNGVTFIGMITGKCAIVLSPVFSRMSHEKLNPTKRNFSIMDERFEKTVKLVSISYIVGSLQM